MSRPIVFLLALLFAAQNAFASAIAPPTGHVNDRAGMLDASTVRLIESFLTDFERRESTQIVVLTVPDLAGQTLEDFSLAVAKQWGIGQKHKDNGVLLLIARDERGIRIEVGYGLEGRLTDLTTGRIIRDVITPAFQQGNFNRGISRGVEAMALAVRGEYQDNGGKGAGDIAGDMPFGIRLFFLSGMFFALFGSLKAGAFSRENKTKAAITGALFAPMLFLLLGFGRYIPGGYPGLGLMMAVGAIGGLRLAAFDLLRRWRWLGSGGGQGGFGGDSFSSGDRFGGGGFSGGGNFGGGGASGRW